MFACPRIRRAYSIPFSGKVPWCAPAIAASPAVPALLSLRPARAAQGFYMGWVFAADSENSVSVARFLT